MKLSKRTRRRFLFDTGMVALGWELSCVDAALSQGFAPTPSCHDGDEPTVHQTEGPFFRPKSPERSDLRQPSAEGRLFELSGFVLTKSCRPLRGAVVDLWHADEKGKYETSVTDIVVMSSPGPRASSAFSQSCQRSTPAARDTITSRFKRRAAIC